MKKIIPMIDISEPNYRLRVINLKQDLKFTMKDLIKSALKIK